MTNLIKDNMHVFIFIGIILSAVFVPALAWYSDYTYRRVMPCTGCSSGLPFVVNDTEFFISGNEQVVWTNSSGYLYYKSDSDYVLTDSSDILLPKDVEWGNDTSYTPSSVYDSNFIGVWHMLPGYGTTVSNSITGGTNGTFVNTPEWTTLADWGFGINTTGQAGGTNHYISIPNGTSTDVIGQHTIEIWLRRNENWATNDPIYYKCDTSGGCGAMRIAMRAVADAPDYYAYCDLFNGANRCNTYSVGQSWSINTTGFDHIVCERNSTHLSIYQNGNLRYYVPCTYYPQSTAQPLNIAFWDAGTPTGVNITVDEFRISNTGRGRPWINQAYQKGIKTLGAEEILVIEITESYDSPVYETDTAIFTLNFTNSSTQDINASLVWNNTIYNSTKISGSATWNFTETVTLPFIITNSSLAGFYWTYNKTWINGTTYEYNYTAHNQTINYAYWISDLSLSLTEVLEGETFTATTEITKAVNHAAYPCGLVEFNNTNYTSTFATNTSAQATFTTSLTAPGVSSITNITVEPYVNVSLGNITRLMYFSGRDITVYPLNLTTSCGTATLEFISRWEANNTSGRELTLEAYFTVYNGAVSESFNFTLGPSTNNTICISPTWAIITADMQAVYYNTSVYTTRPYYFQNITLNNDTQTVYLYSILDDANVNDITFTILDISSIAVPNVLLQVNRWFSGAGEYRMIAVGQSDANGHIIIPLRNTASDYYQFILIQNNEVLNTYSQYQITETEPNNLFTTSTTYLNYFDYIDNIAFACGNTTVGSDITIYCTVSNTDNTVDYYTLTLNRIFSTTNATACANTLDSASGTLTCTIINYTTGYYVWTLKAEFDGIVTTPIIILDSGSFGVASSLIFESNTFGIFITFILILALAGIAKFMAGSNALAVICAVLAVIIAVAFGIFDIGNNIPMVTGMLILAIIVASLVGD